MVLSFGEIVIDLFSGQKGNLLPVVGGAPLNVAIGLRRLGKSPTFASSVGDDWFGERALAYLRENHISYAAKVARGIPTRTAVIFHNKKGERSFRFSPGMAAENVVATEQYNQLLKKKIDVLYFGSLPFAKGDSIVAFEKFVKRARKSGAATLFDPNIRLELFDTPEAARRICLRLMRLADVVRLNFEELLFIARISKSKRDASAIARCAGTLSESFNGTFFVTDGPGGSYACVNDDVVFSRAFDVKTLDSTGCGDAFTAAIISRLFRSSAATGVDYTGLLRWANAAGALAATKLGGADSMPTRNEIEKFVKSRLRGGDNTKRKILISKTRETKSGHFQTKVKKEDVVYATS